MIQPIIETNWAFRNVNELDKYIGPGNYTSISGDGAISNLVTRPEIGPYAFASINSTAPRGKFFAARNQVSASVFMNHNVTNPSSGVTLFILKIGSSYSSVYWNASQSSIRMDINGTLVPLTVSAGPIVTAGRWYHLAIIYKAAAAGFFSLYVDGVQVMRYDGNTGNGNIEGVFFGGSNNPFGSSSASYWTSFYAHDTDGEPDSPPPAYEFPILPVSANGFYTGNWAANGAPTTLQCVDDYPVDGDATFMSIDSAGVKESFSVGAPPANFVPPGYVLQGLIPTVYAKKIGSAATAVRLGLRDATGEQSGAADIALNTDYREVNERFDTKSNSSPWTAADIAGTEIVVESAGAF